MADRHGYRPVLTDLDEPSPEAGGLVVAMKACGLCGTDIEKIRGEYTASRPVIGHEAVGVVTAVGPGAKGFRVGDHVFPHHHVPCYRCHLCMAGNETMCDDYRSSNLVPGGFSESFAVPSWNVERGGVLKIPDTMSYDVAALIEPLACCIRAVRKAHVEAGEDVLVAGAGPVGMMHALLLKPIGVKVTVSDIIQSRLEFAEELAVGSVLDASKGDVPAKIASMTEGRGADVAIVASGSKGAILQGLRSVRKGGRVCLFGVPPKGTVLEYDIGGFYNAEQELLTSYGATETDTKAALKVLTGNGPAYARLVTNRFSLSRFDDALEAMSSGKALKVIVTP
jgi:L-iditol 2-dehydrogenase